MVVRLRLHCRSSRGTSHSLRPEMDRFWDKVDKGEPNECWNWQASTKNGGYGQFCVDGEMGYAHRFVMRLEGHDTEGKEVCHKCDNPSCVNPNHLWVGNHEENMRDAVVKERFKNKLEWPDVVEIRRRYEEEDVSYRELAEDYPVSFTQIAHVVNHENWK